MPPPWMSKLAPSSASAHRRALDVPPRPPAPPGALPARHPARATASTARSPSGRACRAPPRPARRPASRRASGARTCRSRDSSPPRTARAPRRHRRGPRATQRLDHRHHLRDVGGRPRLAASARSTPSAPMSSWYQARGLGGDRRDRPPGLGGARVDLVLDVGDVAHVGDVRPRRRRGAAAGRACRTPPPAGRCRYARGRRPSARRRTSARCQRRSARSAPWSASACCRARSRSWPRSRGSPAAGYHVGPGLETGRAPRRSVSGECRWRWRPARRHARPYAPIGAADQAPARRTPHPQGDRSKT